MKALHFLILTGIVFGFVAQGQAQVSTRIARTNDLLGITAAHSRLWPLRTDHYEIQFTDSFSRTNWRTLTNFVFTNYSPAIVHDATTNCPQRFYRLRAVP
jgi:hypothetical protein